MSIPTPAEITPPVRSALSLARIHAAHAMTAYRAGDEEQGDWHRNVSIMHSQLTQAEEAHRLRRETRSLSDHVKRLTRHLAEEFEL